MTYGVKAIHTYTVGSNGRRFYEELILRVHATSFDEAYQKAAHYLQNSACEFTNVNGEYVKTLCIETVDCFLSFDPEDDVQELYSSFSTNNSSLSEEDYYAILASSCEETDLYPLS